MHGAFSVRMQPLKTVWAQAAPPLDAAFAAKFSQAANSDQIQEGLQRPKNANFKFAGMLQLQLTRLIRDLRSEAAAAECSCSMFSVLTAEPVLELST